MVNQRLRLSSQTEVLLDDITAQTAIGWTGNRAKCFSQLGASHPFFLSTTENLRDTAMLNGYRCVTYFFWASSMYRNASCELGPQMLSDSIFEVRIALIEAYRRYCMSPDFEGTYDEEMKSRVRAVISELTRLQWMPGMDLPLIDTEGNLMPVPVIEDWDPTKEQQFYPKPPE